MRQHLYGRHAVRECLRARRRHIHRLLIARGVKPSPVVDEIRQRAQALGIPITEVPRAKLDAVAGAHQGVVLEVGRLPTLHPADLLAVARRRDEMPFLLALDHIEDPHNVGAILRTAEAVGVHGALLPDRRAAGITPAVVSASAGAAEHLPVAVVPNLAAALQTLQKEDLWVVGVEKSPAAQPYHQTDLNLPLALVVGSEGRGLSRRVRQVCDFLIALPMRGQVESLNASVAGALALYEAWRARQFQG
ncbi:MAG: 23S rRNA (guanosine(2251)-2'-O)-methyltransferase RlmB [Caldilineae bacterium]|nr:MAG: 23S rRNA (guanosine(2251)-2'-O)-methyltransferase RlmB [Caldilineae bacterium]